MPVLELVAVGALLAGAAFLLRVAVHAGQTPGGVDTWYYLAYADAFRRRPSLEVRLPQYLLQDEVQSYPPLFPSLLALLPSRVLRRWSWAVSPAVDCLHLLLLFWLAHRITASLGLAALTGAVYALTPQLVSETRSLSGRSFGALLHTVAMVLTMRVAVLDEAWPSLPLALLAGAALFLSSASSSAGWGFATAVLAVAFADPRYLLVAGGSLALAFALTVGRYRRVVANYLHAVDYWRRHRRSFGAHPVRHSPVYGAPGAPRPAARPGFLGGGIGQELLRLFGENPFLLALALAPPGVPPWGDRLYWWAVGLAGLSVLATVLPPLRAFGPGRTFAKAAVFPTAYTLAVGIGSPSHLTTTAVGRATLAALAASSLAIAFFWAYTRRRRTERTESVPDDLRQAVAALSGLPPGGLMVLPYMYADYACYDSGRPILWGGHSGDLSAFATIAPVLTRPIPELAARHGVRYLLLDREYVAPADIGLGEAEPVGRWGAFALYDLAPAGGR